MSFFSRLQNYCKNVEKHYAYPYLTQILTCCQRLLKHSSPSVETADRLFTELLKTLCCLFYGAYTIGM